MGLIGASCAPRAYAEARPRCLLCQQEISSEGLLISWDAQISALDTRTKFLDPCLGCGRFAPYINAEFRAEYRARVKARVRELKKAKLAKERRMKEMEQTRSWPPDTKSLVGEYWAGLCPIDNSEMYCNFADYWECPICRLQIRAHSGGPDIMPLKGLGQFKVTGPYQERINAEDSLPGCGAWRIQHDSRVH